MVARSLSGRCGYVGRRTQRVPRLPHLPLSYGPREPARAFHIEVEHRRDVEGQQLRDHQATYHGKAQRTACLGAGAEARRPLGLAVVGGLVVSQLLTLYITPVFYLYMERARGFAGSIRKRKVGQAGHPLGPPADVATSA